MAQEENREGFICPSCKADFGDVFQLQIHFDENHSNSDPAFVRNIKDLFGKAKKKIIDQKILNKETFSSSSELKITSDDETINYSTGIHFSVDSEPNKPDVKSHFDSFRSLRAKRTDRQAMDTNKLIIRLEKLLRNIPSDPHKRRNHEQSIVPWIPESDVSRCPECTKSFNLTRRKHHCRLCGSIMCHDCSVFIHFDFARRIINPATISQFADVTDEPAEDLTPSKKKQLFSLRRIDSKESVISLLDKSGEPQFRSCGHCQNNLVKRDQKIELQTGEDPIIVQFYDRMKGLMVQGEELSQTYFKMVSSLNNGEEEFNREEAKFLRVKIHKIGEEILFYANKIAGHGVDKEDPRTTSGIEYSLKCKIRQAAIQFIRDNLTTEQKVPTEKEYEHLKKIRKDQAYQRIEEEKNSARIAKLKYEQKQEQFLRRSLTPGKALSSMTRSSSFNRKNNNGNSPKEVMSYDKGFVLSSSNFVKDEAEDNDPMLQQMDIIRGFIQEAKNAKRFDEVKMLETNLKELQIEYQKTKQELEDNYKSYKHIFKSATPTKNGANASSNPFGDDDKEPALDMEDEYDKSGKNPFS